MNRDASPPHNVVSDTSGSEIECHLGLLHDAVGLLVADSFVRDACSAVPIVLGPGRIFGREAAVTDIRMNGLPF